MTDSPTRSPSSATDLGLLLSHWRRAASLTQEELAERAGVSARAVSDIERGLRTGIYRHTAHRLADALELSGADREQLLRSSRRELPGKEAAIRLPVPPSGPLYGRDAEVHQLEELVISGEARLVTITGPPGVGKSRLALEVARNLAARVPAVWFVPLAPVISPEQVSPAVLRALGVPDRVDVAAAILRQARDGSVLVLDNFEHVLDAASWIADLLISTPGLRIIATSRAALRLRTERELPITPLADDAAIELFRARAAGVRPDLNWASEELSIARRIVNRLDRVPLAIELAAAALSHLTLASLEQGLHSRLDPLVDGWRDMPARHRSIDAAVAWSLDLLEPSHRWMIQSVSVFAGTFGIQSAASVADVEAQVALSGLAHLVAQNLVQVAGDLDGWPRYQLLEVVRQCCERDAAQAGKLDLFRSRHLTEFLELAESAEPELHGASRQRWFGRLSAEADNLNAALAFAAESNDADRGLRLATALWRWWRQRGDLNTGRAHFRRLLAIEGGAPQLRARALWGASWLALHQQDKDAARDMSQQLLALSDSIGDPLARRNALTGLGMVARYEGRFDEALTLFREALELAGAAAEPWIFATSIFNVAQPELELGHVQEADALLDDARRRYLELGDNAFAARMLHYKARAALLRNDLARAAQLALDAAQVFRDMDERWGEVESIEVGAAILAAAGKDEAAATGLGAARSAHEQLGSAQLPPDAVIVEKVFASARERAGQRWDQAFAGGSQTPLEAALDDVVSELQRLH